MPERLSLIEHWLTHSCKIPDFTLKPASGDASFRRYFRVFPASGETCIVMDAPPPQEDCRPFVEIEQKLRSAGVHVPAIYEQDLEQGFLLLEDLGDQLYLPLLNEQTVDRLYGDALSALMIMQACVDAGDLPLYDRELLMQEMALFSDWLLDTHLQLSLTEQERQVVGDAFTLLADSALSQPQVFVHRDYHSRNLMLGSSPVPGVIDFQDAVSGPITYDLVSLLRDCYIKWPADRVDEWAMGYYELCVQSGLLTQAHESEFLNWFDLMGAQRHLKAAGIFARLNHRDGKSGYLQDIPRTLSYIVDVGKRRESLAPLGAFIEGRVLPGL